MNEGIDIFVTCNLNFLEKIPARNAKHKDIRDAKAAPFIPHIGIKNQFNIKLDIKPKMSRYMLFFTRPSIKTQSKPAIAKHLIIPVHIIIINT